MRIMGLDVGDRTIGIAVSDELGWTAQGIETIKRTSITKDLKRLEELINERKVNTIVVGFPKNMNNTIGPRAQKTMEFADVLKETFKDIEIVLWDERLTTSAAQRTLIEADVSRKKRKLVVDKIAAIFILQGYLDLRHFQENN